MPILRLKGDYGHFKLLKYTEGRAFQVLCKQKKLI